MSAPSVPSIHHIRLKGPWEWAVPTPSPSLAWTWNRIRLPDEWDRLPVLTGSVWFRRRFNTPTGITPTDRLWVVISTNPLPSAVNVNGQLLKVPLSPPNATPLPVRYELTPYLAIRNLLEIVFETGITPPSPHSGMGQPVMLEIESYPLSQGA